jgi:integrase
MPRTMLTDRFIAGLRPARRVTYFDTRARGLALRVNATTKTWLFVYRRPGGSPQWLTLGAYAALPGLSLAKARTLAADYRHQVDVEGRDPAAEKRAAHEAAQQPAPEAPAVFTFADLAALYATFAKGRKRTWRDDVAKIEKYLIPAWGPLPLRDITRTHVHERLDTLVAKGLTIGVNRVQAVVSRLFTLALDRGLVDAHPAARMLKRFAERAGDRVLTDDEIRALWAGLDAHPGRAADALRLRLLLGQRGGEIAGMAWAEVDLEGAVWALPGARTKNGKPHTVPLPPTAVALLTRRLAARAPDEARVFPALTVRSDDHRALAVLHGGAYEWKDLRRTVATRLAALGYDEATIGRLLNHARHTVTAKHYIQHPYFDEARRAIDAWDRTLQAIVRGDAPEARKVLAHRPKGRR